MQRVSKPLDLHYSHIFQISDQSIIWCLLSAGGLAIQSATTESTTNQPTARLSAYATEAAATATTTAEPNISGQSGLAHSAAIER